MPTPNLAEFQRRIQALEAQVNKLKAAPVSSAKETAAQGVNPFETIPTIIKARAYREAAYSFAASNITAVVFDTISFDPFNIVSTVTGNITPPLPGYYQVSAAVAGLPSVTAYFAASLYKNGGEATRGNQLYLSASIYFVSNVSDLIYFNGTTDYLQLYVYTSVNSAGSGVVGNAILNFLSIVGPF